jgi:hypothetical protein
MTVGNHPEVPRGRPQADQHPGLLPPAVGPADTTFAKPQRKDQAMAKKSPGKKKNKKSSKLRKALELAGEAAEDKGDEVKKLITGKYDDAKSAVGDAAMAVAGKVVKAGKAAGKAADRATHEKKRKSAPAAKKSKSKKGKKK